MPYLAEFITVVVVHLLAVMSPGPDFAMISRNSLVYSRKTGTYSAVGLALGILVHVTYSLVGIGFIISKSIVLFSIIKFLGAGYLIFIGYKSLKAKPHKLSADQLSEKNNMDKFAAIKMGFLTNALNPKATLFFLSLFTQVISKETPLLIQVFYGLEMVTMTFIWFSIVASVLSHSLVQEKFASVHHRIEKFFGVILIALGIKVALSNSR
ncbi:MAG: LysE family transporter [bacterium]|nr:LysE family transporter [bacterium]